MDKIAQKESLSVVQVVPSLNSQDGGLPRAAIALSQHVGATGKASVTLLSQVRSSLPILPTADPNFTCEYGYASGLSRLLASSMWGMIRETARGKSPVIIHSHGLWAAANHWACRIGRRLGAPTVIQPHGMLEKWALKQKPYKKMIGMALYQRQDLESASVLVATSPMEYEAIRASGLRQPVAIVPNGVNADIDASMTSAQALPAPDGAERTVLFLSRIHPKKGLLNLLSAWAQVKPSGWRLVIAGGDSDGSHLAEIRARCDELRLNGSVKLVGELVGSEKMAAFRNADVFVLPSFSENFGIVVVEALSCGLPVIATHGTPWADLETFGCGWWIEVGVAPLKQALSNAMSLDDQARRIMGRKGREYARRFEWQTIGRQMAEVYEWLADLGPRPEIVETY